MCFSERILTLFLHHFAYLTRCKVQLYPFILYCNDHQCGCNTLFDHNMDSYGSVALFELLLLESTEMLKAEKQRFQLA